DRLVGHAIGGNVVVEHPVLGTHDAGLDGVGTEGGIEEVLEVQAVFVAVVGPVVLIAGAAAAGFGGGRTGFATGDVVAHRVGRARIRRTTRDFAFVGEEVRTHQQVAEVTLVVELVVVARGFGLVVALVGDR